MFTQTTIGGAAAPLDIHGRCRPSQRLCEFTAAGFGGSLVAPYSRLASGDRSAAEPTFTAQPVVG